MDGLWLGILIGVKATLLLTAALAWYAWRRFTALTARTRRSERLAELGTLTGGLAHEIKNPLSTIQLNLQLLEEDIRPEVLPGPRVVNRLRTVRQEAARLREILDDFLRYAGRMELEKQPIDLNQLVESIGDFFLPQASLHGIKLRVTPAPVPVLVHADSKLLKQAVLNLLLNATQAMPGGGELMLRSALDDRFAVIDVTDTGPGIEPDKLNQIFQAYYSTKKGGTGLGLPMTRRIAEEHGGTVVAHSEVGKGSRFSLRVPSG